jgi:hypothetical protein
MLDISLKALEKVITNPKKAADFLRKHVVAVEKIDGTKLTLIRNDAPFDPKDYTKNWIVAYKGSIIYPTEFQGLEKREKDIKTSALGTSQYKFVHDHLRKIHSGTGEVPLNTEFFVEFVQNKPTITRDYARKHGMYLVGFGPTKFAVSRGQLFSSSNFVDSPGQLETYREILQLGSFPVVFDGNLSTRKSILEGCIDPSLKEMFSQGFDTTDFSDPVSIVSLVTSVFSRLESSLGGPAEGVVLQVGDDDMSQKQLLKILAADQHSKEVRGAKRSRSKGTEEEEANYWRSVNELVDGILDELPRGEPSKMLDALSRAVYKIKDIPAHPVKTPINVSEDIFLTAKLRLLGTGTHRANKVAVIPMAAKPFHAGHDSLIKKAVRDGNDSVIVFVSTGGREEISAEDMIPLWRDYYIPGISSQYGDKVVIRFSDSPMREALLVARDLVNRGKKTIVRLYGGIDSGGEDEAKQRVAAILEKNPDMEGRIIPVGVERSGTGGVSGTAMRGYVSSKDAESFVDNLPDWLGNKEKLGIWRAMSKIYAGLSKNENLVRRYVRSVLRS